MKTSLVITVLNEESTVDWLLEAIQNQLVMPDEIILVDGGSKDKTVRKIKKWQKNKEIGGKIRLFQKKGNRSTGRNFGIQKAKHDWIAITDAGCLPYQDWLQALLRTQRATQSEVIAGYYHGIAQSRFEEAVIPYVLVMPNRINPKKFLPATRSMLIHKSVWKKLGGFDDQLDHNEDFAFAKKIERAKIQTAFSPEAVVGWLPRKSLSSFWQMIFRFALGDIQAGIIRPKVMLIFFRYLIFLSLLGWMIIINQLPQTGSFFPVLIFLYIIWSVMKNKHNVPHGWLWLPVLQVTSDLAVMAGSLAGVFFLIDQKKSASASVK